MFTSPHTTSYYQATRGAIYTARRLTLLQRFLLERCDGRLVTLADLAKAAHRPADEVSDALNFLRAHALVRLAAPRF